jgi:lysophospholipase L1-like esterase
MTSSTSPVREAKLRKVVLIGDSIRIGYQEYVEEFLKGLAVVRFPKGSSFTSTDVLIHVDDWIIAHKPDVVHINCGLHDVRREKSTGKIKTPLGRYKADISKILQRIVHGTSAKLIWATSTPVNEEWHNEIKDFDRFLDDIRVYNAVSIEICRELGVEVNDLYGRISKAGADALLAPDGVHFVEEGWRTLGREVAERIKPHL